MSKIGLLYLGELQRMRKYGISAASLGVIVIWVVFMWFLGVNQITTVFPLILFIDASIMSLLYAGVTLIYERKENALSTLFTTPVQPDEFLLAKTASVVSAALLTLLFLVLYGLFFASLKVNILAAVGAVLLIGFAFAQVGIVLTYRSRDFTDLITQMFLLTLLFGIPTVLSTLGVIQAEWFSYVQYINPLQHALVIMQASVITVPALDLAIAIPYLTLMGGGLYAFARRYFPLYVARGGGS